MCRRWSAAATKPESLAQAQQETKGTEWELSHDPETEKTQCVRKPDSI